ncbi:dihydrodipicolinate synthetase [Curvularia kusanoi]|uniref:Dihydrodipicolinate synthetase n=1 Tax=Curvularia kusanoi TaxID=90978 RepID=A0A9P4T3P9_CURKU|nr:dihydrodipicolinate synthetase [Curvularia kusanoi]
MASIDSKQYDRLFIAMVLPFHADESIDEQGLRNLIRYFVEKQKKTPRLALIVNPEAGEVFYLTPEEQLSVIKIALEEVKGAMPVYTGIFANATKGLVDMARRASDLQVDGLFLMPPTGAMDITIAWDAVRYPEVFADSIGAVVKAIPHLPILIHPTAAPTAAYGVGLPVEATMTILERYPQVVGWKMVYNYEGNRKVSRSIKSLDRHVAILGATAVLFHENLAMGHFDGTVTGSFNYALEPMVEHIAAWESGNLELARKIWWDDGLAELHEYIYQTFGRLHVRYKVACWLRGLIESPLMRQPMPKPRKEEVEELYQLFSKLDISLISKDKVSNYVLSLAD